MATKTKAWWVAGLIFFFALSLAQPGQGQQTIRAGYIPIVSLLPFYAAQNNDYFVQEGLKITAESMAGGAVIIPAVIGGSLEVGFASYFSVFAARERGIDIAIVASMVREVGLPRPYVAVLVRDDGSVNTAKDLEGKTFTVNTIKAVDWLTTSEWMALNGADPKKVTWVELPFPAMGGALRAKKVDGMTGVDPFMSEEMERAGVKAIGYPFAAIDPKLPIAGWVATEGWLKQNRPAVDRFVRALHRGIDFVNANPEKIGEILVKFTRMKPELAAKLKFYPAFDKQIDGAALQKTVDLAVKWGLIAKRMDVKEMALPGVLK